MAHTQEISKPQRTVLLAPSAPIELVDALVKQGIDVTRWPPSHIGRPGSFHSLDEAAENLFGYDWVVFVSDTAVISFLDRFLELEHDISEMDAVRVCAIGESTLAALDNARVHVDVVAQQFGAKQVVEDIAAYVDSQGELDRQNFLIPQAMIGRAYLKRALEDAGARADVIAAYETVPRENALRLMTLQTILSAAGIDCVIFDQPEEVKGFARVFDTLDLSPLLTGTAVACNDKLTAEAAKQLGAFATIIGRSAASQMAKDVAAYLLP